jgi:hypothetical protein
MPGNTKTDKNKPKAPKDQMAYTIWNKKAPKSKIGNKTKLKTTTVDVRSANHCSRNKPPALEQNLEPHAKPKF